MQSLRAHVLSIGRIDVRGYALLGSVFSSHLEIPDVRINGILPVPYAILPTSISVSQNNIGFGALHKSPKNEGMGVA